MLICEVCLDELNGPKLFLGEHPLCDDLVPITESKVSKKFNQTIHLCKKCLTAHQLFPVAKEILFTPAYKYRAGITIDVLEGMDDLAEKALQYKLTKPNLILDIGCNDGSLLGIFKSKTECLTIGVDPTDAIRDGKRKIDFPYNAYFDKTLAEQIKKKHGTPDIVTFTNVFAHIENLSELLEALSLLIDEDTLLIIENHYLGAILDRNQIDTFYHEHPRTYSATSFKYISRRLKMNIVNLEFTKRYGGNIRVFMSSSPTFKNLDIEFPPEYEFLDKFDGLNDFFSNWLKKSLKKVAKLSQNGAFVGKSMPGRASMLISALGLTENQMTYVYEQDSSPKVGHYVPGTKIQIRGDTEFFENRPKVVIVWAWHIVDEICAYLKQNGFVGEVWVPLPEFKLYSKIE